MLLWAKQGIGGFLVRSASLKQLLVLEVGQAILGKCLSSAMGRDF
ncbi:hypothetical protein [Candidatus Chlorohelix allophototropha]